MSSLPPPTPDPWEQAASSSPQSYGVQPGFDPYAEPHPHGQPAAQPPGYAQPNPYAMSPAPSPYGAYPQYGVTGQPGAGLAPWQYAAPVGQVRGTGLSMLLNIVTLGIYPLVWFYQVHDEMQRHTGQGLGGGVALLLMLVFSPAMFFVTPGEIGQLYRRRGMNAPVSAANGLWILLPIIGPIIWFVQTNSALNDYWRSLGVTG